MWAKLAPRPWESDRKNGGKKVKKRRKETQSAEKEQGCESTLLQRLRRQTPPAADNYKSNSNVVGWRHITGPADTAGSSWVYSWRRATSIYRQCTAGGMLIRGTGIMELCTMHFNARLTQVWISQYMRRHYSIVNDINRVTCNSARATCPQIILAWCRNDNRLFTLQFSSSNDISQKTKVSVTIWPKDIYLLNIKIVHVVHLSLIHIWRCRRIERCRSRWSPYH